MDEQSIRLVIIIILSIITLTALLIVFFFVLRSQKRNSKVIREDDDIHGALAQYNCPKCNQTMEKGFVVAGRGIIYRKDDGPMISPFSTIFSVLHNTMSYSFQPAVNRAWHCEHCKYLLLDHSAMVKRKKK